MERKGLARPFAVIRATAIEVIAGDDLVRLADEQLRSGEARELAATSETRARGFRLKPGFLATKAATANRLPGPGS